MSAMLDSRPVFETRLAAMGVNPANIQGLLDNDIDTLAKSVYCSGVQPGGADETPFLTVIAKAWKIANPVDIPLGQLSAIRRCWYESHTVAIAEIRDRVQRTEGSEPARMPVPERESRLRDQQQRLSGVHITSALEPAHQLVDFCNQLRSDEQLKYIDPARCTSREQEVKGVKSESFLKQQSDGSIKIVNKEDGLKADLTGEFKVRLALQRRSLAMDVVKIATYAEMESYHDHLFNLMLSDVPDTHERISLQQILQADKMVFTRMIEKTRAGISQRADGSFPIHEALKLAIIDPIVNACLQPLPRSSYRQQSKQEYGPYPVSAGKQRGPKGKGKGKGKRNVKGSSGLPEELKGLKTHTNSGVPICFACNTDGGCSYAKWSQKCGRGLHVCMRCGGHHAATSSECRAKSGQ